jgi:hypothetical protein
VPDLRFQVEQAEAVGFAASPLLDFRLRVDNTNAAEPIHAVVLRVQIQIQAARRSYSDKEQEGLLDLFGEPNRWFQTLRPLLWTHASVVIPPFTGHTIFNLPVPCTFDFNVAATKFFHALSEGEVPLQLMFSGSVFYANADGALQVSPISWDNEASFRLPVKVWKEMMDLYYPNTTWLCLRRDVFEQLLLYKSERGIPTWEQALESIIPPAKQAAHR